MGLGDFHFVFFNEVLSHSLVCSYFVGCKGMAYGWGPASSMLRGNVLETLLLDLLLTPSEPKTLVTAICLNKVSR